MTNITLGQYFPADSFIHRLDPRSKIIISLAMLVIIFFIDTFIGFAFAGVFFAVCVIMSKVTAGYIFRTLRPVFFIVIFTFVLNMLFFDGDTVWFDAGGIIKITQEGFVRAVFMSVRLILLILSTSLLTLTTSPLQLTDGLELLAAPLRKVKVPVHEIAMMMSIALRFIPTLTDEADRIKKAQTARGADFGDGNMFARARNLIPLLVPLFVSAFKRADELAMAMESRCYHGGEGRTKMKVYVFSGRDAATVAVSLAVLVLLAVFL